MCGQSRSEVTSFVESSSFDEMLRLDRAISCITRVVEIGGAEERVDCQELSIGAKRRTDAQQFSCGMVGSSEVNSINGARSDAAGGLERQTLALRSLEIELELSRPNADGAVRAWFLDSC